MAKSAKQVVEDTVITWANQAYSKANDSRMFSNIFSFHGDTLYSYTTPIARILRDEKGDAAGYVVTKKFYSNTTSRQLSEVKRVLEKRSLPTYFCAESIEDYWLQLGAVEKMMREVIAEEQTK